MSFHNDYFGVRFDAKSRQTSVAPRHIDLIRFPFFFPKVKVLYARNLLLSTTEETIEQVFSKFGEVEWVKKIKDYSFIHFRTKEQARAALEAMNGNKTFMFMFLWVDNYSTGTPTVFQPCECIPRCM